MNRKQAPLHILFLVIVAVLPLGCLQGDGNGSRFLLERSSLNGDWRMTYEILSDDCGNGTPGITFPVHYRIEQTSDSLVVTRFPACAPFGPTNDGATGTGSVTGEVVTFTISQTFPSGPDCTQQTIQVASGAFDGVKIKGEITTGIAGSGDCGTGLPCRIVSRFTMTRCTDGECSSGIVCEV